MKMNITLCSLAALAITMSSWTSTAEAHGVARKNSHKRMVHEKRQQFSGQATFYNTETGNAGACGRYLKNTEYVVAVNTPQYNQAWCGKTITITANGKSHTATIEDECPGDGTTCKWGALDMSPALFRYFADESAGVFDMSWSIGGGGGNIVDNVVSSVTGGNKNKGNNNKQSSNNDNDDDEAAKQAEAQKQAAASKAAAEASRSSASAAAYASSTSAAAAASESRASASSAARASATSAAAASSSSSAAAESRSEASESRASVKAAKSSSSAAAASASVEAARPKNIENFDALFGGLQQLAMAAQA